jgi:hypothetical protein
MAAMNQIKQVPMMIDSSIKIVNYENVVEEMRTIIQKRSKRELFN